MNILITGAAGFIGYHLSKELLKKGHEVVGIDNINDYYDPHLKIARLSQLGISKYALAGDGNGLSSSENIKGFKFKKLDIVNRSSVELLLKDHNFDVIVHLAAQAGVRYSLENPTAYVETNVLGFQYLLDAACHTGVKHFIYASSSSIYGFNDSVPFRESDRVDYPVSMYAATKRSSELMAYTYSHLYDFPTSGLRFFTVYGPWGRPDMAPMLFAKAILEGKAIKVFNKGNLFRDFTYIEDITNGVTGLIEKGPLMDHTIGKPYSIFNIGNSKPVNLLDFIKVMERELGIKAKKELVPMQPGDVFKTYADTSKLKDHTGYIPQTDLEEGIRKFVRWYREYFSK